jgi:RNA polymerase sigma-70 factor (ECF subfamily)
MSIAMTQSAGCESLAPEFEDLFREHYSLVYRTAYSITGSRHDAEDVLQTIFLRLLQREISPDVLKNPKAYLYRAAVNMSLNTVRSRKRSNLTDADVEVIETPVAASETDEDDSIQRALLDAIATLKPRAVEILILRYEHDYSDVEIARMLGKSRGTIAVTLYRARHRLKKLLRATLGKTGEVR